MSAENDPKTFLANLPTKDKELREKISEAMQKEQLDEVDKLLAQRESLYIQALGYPIDNFGRILFSGMEGDVALQRIFFKMKKDFEKQISVIITQLEDLRNDVTVMKEKLNNR